MEKVVRRTLRQGRVLRAGAFALSRGPARASRGCTASLLCSRNQTRIAAAADVAAAESSDMPESWTNPPKGFKVYETMIIYNPDAQDKDREDDIQDFEDFLASLGALDIAVSYENVPQRMAYPIEGYNVGIYVLFMYSAPASAAKVVQGKLSAPSIEKEKTILRFMTTRA